MPADRLRIARRAALILALLAVHLPLHGLWRLFGRASPWPRRFLGATGRAAGFDVTMEGTPLPRDVLFVANHLSWIDILLVAGATGARFVAKDEVRGWPVIGWLAGLNATVYVARAERGRVHEQADRLRTALAEGQPVMLFPEGGTGLGETTGPFRASLFSALVPPPRGIRLQPIAIDYGAARAAMLWHDEVSTGAETLRILAMPGRRRVVLRICAPIDPATIPDRKALGSAARAEICAALGETPSLPV
jgi:lyso-ornithine lipid O-acyltransferase